VIVKKPADKLRIPGTIARDLGVMIVSGMLRPGMVLEGEVEASDQRKVSRSGRAVELTVKEFSLLEFLLQRRGRCCTRSELLREVWQMSPDAGTNVVDVYVNYLRRKLGAAAGDGDGYAVIETVRGEGYRMGGAAKMAPRASECGAEAMVAGA